MDHPTGLKKRTPLEHHALVAFEAQLKGLLELAFDGGIRALEAAGFKLGDDLVDDRAREHFRNGLFDSFAEAQSEAGLIVVELERKRRGLTQQLKAMRTGRDPRHAYVESELAAVSNRLLVLRRLIDGILWIALPNHSVLQRMAADRKVRDPEPEELEALLAIAEQLNRSHPRELHLVSDLTSIVQLGDILRIRWDEGGVYLRLNEIKRGKVNDALTEILDAHGGKLSEEDLSEVALNFGASARQQVERMARQRARFQRFSDLAQSDQYESLDDPELKRLAAAKPPPMATYLHLLPKVVADAKAHALTFDCIDDCLWLIGLSEAGLEQLRDARELQHRLFHAKNPQLSCEITEIQALNRESPLVNLAGHNLVHVFSRPPLIWYPKDLVLDVTMDRVRIYAQFDLEAFSKLAAKVGFRLSLIVGKEAEEGKKRKVSGPMLENPKAYGVRVEFQGGKTIKLRSSLFRSVYSDLVRPTAILSLLATLRENL